MPSFVTVFDLNEDNVGDILVALPGSSGIGLFTGGSVSGYADGTFGAMTLVSTGAGTSPRTVVSADVAEDGVPDLLVADEAGDLIVLVGQGSNGVPSSSFDPPVAYSAGAGTVALAVGDLDKDSVLDVVLAARDDDAVAVMMGNGSSGKGDGTFSKHSTDPQVPVGTAPVWVALGDLDGDSILDMVTADRNDDTISIRLGTGTGAFSTPAQGTLNSCDSPSAVIATDLDMDGFVDLACACAVWLAASGLARLRTIRQRRLNSPSASD